MNLKWRTTTATLFITVALGLFYIIWGGNLINLIITVVLVNLLFFAYYMVTSYLMKRKSWNEALRAFNEKTKELQNDKTRCLAHYENGIKTLSKLSYNWNTGEKLLNIRLTYELKKRGL